MGDQKPTEPYWALGIELKRARETRSQTLAEVSGAVEIDEAMLTSIEQGVERPSEDILMLLISYFDLHEEKAAKLWELAGYIDNQKNQQKTAQNNIFEFAQPVTMLMPMDLRVVYTDMVHVMANDFGIVMNFMQAGGSNGQPLAVARVGMSKDHAKSVLDILQKTLAQADKKQTQKLLPPKQET
jgi:transcriptional regulator with XRE-family HTH domain